MEPLQGDFNQLHFSLTVSQMIVSFGILALAAIWGRLKAGILLSLGSVAYWGYSANKLVLAQLAETHVYGVIMTLSIGLFLSFLIIYAWVAPSAR